MVNMECMKLPIGIIYFCLCTVSVLLIYRCFSSVSTCVLSQPCAPLHFLCFFLFYLFFLTILSVIQRSWICTVDGETFEFLSMYNPRHFSSSLPFLSWSLYFCLLSVSFGHLSINHARNDVSVTAVFSLKYVIIHCMLSSSFFLRKNV